MHIETRDLGIKGGLSLLMISYFFFEWRYDSVTAPFVWRNMEKVSSSCTLMHKTCVRHWLKSFFRQHLLIPVEPQCPIRKQTRWISIRPQLCVLPEIWYLGPKFFLKSDLSEILIFFSDFCTALDSTSGITCKLFLKNASECEKLKKELIMT